ncbi:hypothetical protein [Streptomyces sp. NPDC006459]|uniref:hypothetical protein n=1 Tax=Streptomyces sp. NPDC006459 TaxID=3154303 RepID=UPI0033B32EC2
MEQRLTPEHTNTTPNIFQEMWGEIAERHRLQRKFHDPKYGAPEIVSVYTQRKLDKALCTPGILFILVQGRHLTLSRAPDDPECKVIAKNDMEVVGAVGNAEVKVYVHDRVRVTAFEKAVVHADGDGRVRALDEAQVHAYGNAEVDASYTAQVTAHDNVRVWANEGARVVADGTARVSALGRAQVWAGGSAWVAACDSVTVTGQADTVRIWATESATVEAAPTTVLRTELAFGFIHDWSVLENLWEPQNAANGQTVLVPPVEIDDIKELVRSLKYQANFMRRMYSRLAADLLDGADVPNHPVLDDIRDEYLMSAEEKIRWFSEECEGVAEYFAAFAPSGVGYRMTVLQHTDSIRVAARFDEATQWFFSDLNVLYEIFKTSVERELSIPDGVMAAAVVEAQETGVVTVPEVVVEESGYAMVPAVAAAVVVRAASLVAWALVEAGEAIVDFLSDGSTEG